MWVRKVASRNGKREEERGKALCMDHSWPFRAFSESCPSCGPFLHSSCSPVPTGDSLHPTFSLVLCSVTITIHISHTHIVGTFPSYGLGLVFITFMEECAKLIF
jgi:hypothetical protein